MCSENMRQITITGESHFDMGVRSPVNSMHIFRTPFTKKTSGRLPFNGISQIFNRFISVDVVDRLLTSSIIRRADLFHAVIGISIINVDK